MPKKPKPPSRRTRGTGTWFRRKDGRVVIRLTVVTAFDAVERLELTLPKTTTDAEAEAQLGAYVAAKGAGRLHQRAPLLAGAYLADWLATRLARKRINTRRTYASLVRQHIAPAVGHLDIGALHQRHLNALWAQMDADGLSRATIKLARGIVVQALTAARADDLVAVNVAELSRLPDAAEDEEAAPRDVEPAVVRALLRELDTHPYALVFHLAARRGLRIGEILALPRDAIDLEVGLLEVRQTLVGPRGGWTINGPKTKHSRRTLPLSPDLVVMLRQRLAQQAHERIAGGGAWRHARESRLTLEGRRTSPDLIFTYPDGRPVGRQYINQALARACRTLGVPRISMHWLRHAANSVLQAEGVPIEDRMAILGHASQDMNLHYTHVQLAAMAVNLESVDKKFGT